MPRKKSTKRTNKRQKATNVLVNVQKMEKDFIQTPLKMAAQLTKEIKKHQKQESKFNKTISKLNNQLKKTEGRINAITKAKPTATSKKKLKVLTKKYNQAQAIQSQFDKQLQTVTNSLDNLLSNQARFNALGKCINQFNNDWAKAAKKAKAEAKAKSKQQVARKKSNVKNKAKSASVEQLHIQPVENTLVNSSLDEVTDLAS